MSATVLGQSGKIRQYAQSWAFSLLLHALAVGSAVVFLGDLKMVPEPEPFKWDVALVETPQPKPVKEAAPAEAKPTQPAPTKPAQAVEAPIEPQPVPQPVQTVQAVQPVERKVVQQPVEQKIVQQDVQQEVREVNPVVTQTIQLTPHPVEAPQEQPKDIAQTAAVYPVPSEPASRASLPNQAAPAMPETPPVAHSYSGPMATATPPLAPPAPASAAAAPPAIQEATFGDASARPASAGKTDYGWLAKALWNRVAMLKRYPHTARVNHLEGRVLLRVVIKEDGHIRDLQVAESSGHWVLDQDALEVVRRACPLKLAQPLGRSHVVVQLPINYRLEH
ncbi:MAG: TonB family protein [Nitrospira sp.]|nr:TonB family protein [Nitrospira sp.]